MPKMEGTVRCSFRTPTVNQLPTSCQLLAGMLVNYYVKVIDLILYCTLPGPYPVLDEMFASIAPKVGFIVGVTAAVVSVTAGLWALAVRITI